MNTWQALQKSTRVLYTTFSYLRQAKKTGVSDELKMAWARDVLNHIGLKISVFGKPSLQEPLLLVGNHVSYLDIPVLLAVVPGIRFLAKQEVGRWPLFGYGAKLIGTVFVKRDQQKSRLAAREALKQSLLTGNRMVVFPSGTTCLGAEKPWKKGAFEIAAELNCLIQPFRLLYDPSRIAAFINDDQFAPHLLKLCKTPFIEVQVDFHEPVYVRQPVESASLWQDWAGKYQHERIH